MFVDELGMTIASQQDAEVIEPGHHSLKLYPVHKENRQGRFVLADVIEERVLQVL